MADASAIVDVAFRLPGGRLPVDHAHALLVAIAGALPWLDSEHDARVHQIHTAATGAGWTRPDDASEDELHLSRRTRLVLRLPERRAGDAMALTGRALDVAGCRLTPGAGKIVALAPAPTLLARHMVLEEGEDESRLLERLHAAMTERGLAGVTVICGRAHRITTGDGVLETRSIVVTNLDPDGAMILQREGMGPAGKLGCGIFIPYKHID